MQQALWYWWHYRYVGLGFLLLFNGGPTMTALMGGLVAAKVLNFTAILAVATLVDLAGDSFWYFLARWRGPRLIRSRLGRLLGMNEDKIARFERHFLLHGGKILLTGKFTEVIHAWCVVAAGMARMSWRSFYFWDVSASLLKSLTFMTVGYFFMEVWIRLDGWFLHTAIIALAIAIYLGLMNLARSRSAMTKGTEK